MTWAEMSAVAQQLSDQHCEADTLKVIADRRSTGLLTVSGGLAAWDQWTDVFEPLRKRRMFGWRWKDVQTLHQAAERVEVFLRERPDQAHFKD